MKGADESFISCNTLQVYFYSFTTKTWEDTPFLHTDAPFNCTGITIPAPSSVEKRDKNYGVVRLPFGIFYLCNLHFQIFGFVVSSHSLS